MIGFKMKKKFRMLVLLTCCLLHSHLCHAMPISKKGKKESALKDKKESQGQIDSILKDRKEPQSQDQIGSILKDRKDSESPNQKEPVSNAANELENIYLTLCKETSDINEHLPTLKQLSSECSSVIETGLRSKVSPWVFLKGLSESQNIPCTYLWIDREFPLLTTLQKVRELATSHGIFFHFWKADDRTVDIASTDLLFIDSLHTYCHLTHELEKFSPRVNKYIAMHHTSPPWGLNDDDSAYHGDYSEYDPMFDRTKRGLWPAVIDFLGRHPEWSLYERSIYDNGLIILKRTELISGDEAEPGSRIEEALQNKIILCTGPSLNRKMELKTITESDMKFISFKKIFLSTNDLANADVVFNDEKPFVSLLDRNGHMLDCTNCIISTLRNVVNDPFCEDDDIILFKHESVFINDMILLRKAIGKILDGCDAVTRFCHYTQRDMTDAFLIKVSSARKLLCNRSNLTNLDGYIDCEDYFTKTVISQLPKVYRVQMNRYLRHWEHNELGFFHTWPHPKRDRDTWGEFWDRKNYNELYRE